MKEMSLTVQTDGCTGITDTAYNDWFGGDAAKGVAGLAAAGAVTVNGTRVDGKEVFVNGGKALWKNGDGTWSWKTHIMRHGGSVSYEQAAVGFIDGLSRLRGPSYTLRMADGRVIGIDFVIYDAAFAETVTVGDTYTVVTICGPGGDGSMNRARPDEIRFPNELVEADSEGVPPSDQCLILYWQDAEGWHLKRADSKKVTVETDRYSAADSRINLEYSMPWHRPTQPIQALGCMGADRAEMIQWFYRDGIVSGASHADARAMLPAAVAAARAALETAAVSEDGTDVAAGRMWVTQEYHTAFAQAVADAEAALAAAGERNNFYEEAYFRLALAYGGDGSHYSMTGNIFKDGIGFMTFAKAHLGTR